MRTIELTTRFKRDYRRESKGQHGATLDASLRSTLWSTTERWVPRYRDHPLRGEWADHRDCHVKPDLVLIYRKPDAETLLLVRLGPPCGARVAVTRASCGWITNADAAGAPPHALF